MAKSPQFPVTTDKEMPPFLNDGQSKVELVNIAVVDGPPQKPIPAWVIDVKVIESNNPMNGTNQTHTIRVNCLGFSWGKTVQEIVAAASSLPRSSLSTENCEALAVSGKLKGRKFMVEQTTKTGPSKRNPGETAMWREYRCVSLDTTPAI